ncbi:hypothetical protein M231_02190 [Tremella mesenterica]|uniref:Hemerythrin-like domain-containing protein n=1 Tax=Tremella mesenterica TaxID=5217 RepID=A0A4Q1BRF9_TREME|nr:hypothetical protein M231_02190 [Tremella mesenterica]
MSKHALPLPLIDENSVFSSEEYKSAKEKFKGYMNAGKPSEWQKEQAWAMACAHDNYLDLIMRVYAFAEDAIKRKDLENYLGFAETALAHTVYHHQHEEDFAYPLWTSWLGYNPLPSVSSEHASFASSLQTTLVYIQTVRQSLHPAIPSPISPLNPAHSHLPNPIAPKEVGLDPSKPFDPVALRKYMDVWVPAMISHLSHEVDELTPIIMEAIGRERLKEFDKLLQNKLRAIDPSWFLVPFVGTWPRNVEKDVMGLPLIVRKVLIPFVWSRKYWGWWKYLARPENLTFLGE